jgi:cytoskeletal protein RodZ
MTAHHKEEKKEITLKAWIGNLLSLAFIGIVGFLCSTVLHSWKMQVIDDKLHQQDITNAITNEWIKQDKEYHEEDKQFKKELLEKIDKIKR